MTSGQATGAGGKPTTVFVSYSRADQTRALPVIELLERAGFAVWWDGLIGGGERFSRTTATALDTANFYARLKRTPAGRAGQVLAQVGLEAHGQKPVGALSGGMKQRLALGCAMVHEPPILFLDEPTSGVDPLARRRFWDLIDEMAAAEAQLIVGQALLDEGQATLGI
jgi:ABC-type branched-subunit amino acid transport system ATPase component